MFPFIWGGVDLSFNLMVSLGFIHEVNPALPQIEVLSVTLS